MTTPYRFTQISLFQPTQISGCTVWLDGADPNGNGTIPSNGSAVSSWTDKSSNGMTVSAASSLPTYSRSLQNGLGAVTYNGSQNLTTGNVLASKFAGTTSNLTIFCVNSFSNTVTGGTYASPFCWANAGAYPRICLTVGNNADGVMMDVGASGTGRTTYAVPPPTFDSRFYMTSYWKSGANTQLNLNGSNKASSSTQDTTGFASSTYAFNVGAAYASSIWNMRGDIGEILFYNSTLSTQNFQLVEGYLAWKWGLQTSLPSTHPYRNTPVYGTQPFPLVPRVPYATQSSSFQPTTITGCYVWLDASTPNNFTFNSGSNIATWIDRSGNSYTATAANNPTYDAVNERVRFTDTSSQYMSNTAAPLNLAQRSFFFVIEDVTYVNVGGYMPIIPNPTTGTDYQTSNGLTIENNVGFKFYGNSGGYNLSIAGSAAPNAKGIYSEVFGSLSGTVYKNGTAGGTGSSTYTPGTSVGYALGGRWNNGIAAPYINSYYYEVIVYNRALSVTQRQQIEGYLAWKWNLQGSLPSNHPYKNTPVYAQPPFPLVSRIPYLTNKYFNPTNITGCVIWFDGADTSQMTMTGTTVNTWISKGSASLTATSVGAGSIVYEKYNGINSLRFNGTNTKMTTGTIASYGASATTWITASVNLTTVTSTTPVDASLVFATSGAPEKSIRYTQTPGSQLYTFNNGSFRDSQNFTNGVRGFIDTAASFTAYVNGSNVTNSTSAVTYQAGVNQSFSMGQWNTGTLNGYIQEILVFNSALTLPQYQQVEGYLAWKWGFQTNLPASHPYKLFPPSP